MTLKTEDLLKVIHSAGVQAAADTGNEPEPELTQPISWPITSTVGPGLEGAIACESKVGYVNGAKGWLVYRGYDIFELCANATYEEVCYLLLHGELPTEAQLYAFKKKLASYRYVNGTLRVLMGFPVEKMNPMAALRLGTNLLRQEFSFIDIDIPGDDMGFDEIIAMDDDSFAMETPPLGEKQATYEFHQQSRASHPRWGDQLHDAKGYEAAYHLIAGIPTLAAAISRVRQGHMPIEPDPHLSLSANFLYMLTGYQPSELEERMMDVCLILHADHGMNASTFAAMVVASTLSDVYFSVGSGIAALNGPLHGGANEQVLKMLEEIRSFGDVQEWLDERLMNKEKVMGFGHRVYKAYDPRARVLGPLAELLTENHEDGKSLLSIAKRLESEMIDRFGESKKIFPNVDFYSGIVYNCLGIPADMFTSVFAVARVSGWTARVLEYLKNNRIFRPRAIYTGDFGKTYTPIEQRQRRDTIQ
ncbi:MAG: citrate/2-methylcitrate synthase [Deltaproteobacteria bacterium]|nr:citrate/2-methylcitrate synthase [Deltaproteobacteria bacterium]MBN2674767.1 citrate/2-methylcitrate synthase [Deltaproteobacteria bacterium]